MEKSTGEVRDKCQNDDGLDQADTVGLGKGKAEERGGREGGKGRTLVSTWGGRMPRAFMSWKNDSSFLAASSLKGMEDSGGRERGRGRGWG